MQLCKTPIPRNSSTTFVILRGRRGTSSERIHNAEPVTPEAGQSTKEQNDTDMCHTQRHRQACSRRIYAHPRLGPDNAKAFSRGKQWAVCEIPTFTYHLPRHCSNPESVWRPKSTKSCQSGTRRQGTFQENTVPAF